MSWFSRLRNVFRKDLLDRELDEEMLFHADERAADLGLSATESRRRLGKALLLREESRDAKLATWLETLLQDLRFAVRMWRRRPLVALTAMLTMALGAGMNIAVFQVIWVVMLKPLPYPDADRLVQVWLNDGKEERVVLMNNLVDEWRERTRTFEHIASYRPWRVTVAGGAGDPEQAPSAVISPEYFATLGTPMFLGRAFTADEMKPGADDVILLREGYWKRRFAADPSILGTGLAVDGRLCRVVGIVPDSFRDGPVVLGSQMRAETGKPEAAGPDVYLPLTRARTPGMRTARALNTSFVIGRLAQGPTIEQARDELVAIAAPREKRRIWLSSLQEEIGYKLRPALVVLLASTGCILLIACANLANLLTAQAVMRRRELAVRSALGAGRGRVVRQLILEALALLAAGAFIGLFAGLVVSSSITALYPEFIPRIGEGGPQWIPYALALAAAMGVGLLFGALPALRVTGFKTEAALRVGNSWMGRDHRRWADALVSVQVALTAVVLVGAALLFESFLHLRDIDIGFNKEHVITASVDLPEALFKTREDRARFGEQWLEHLNAIPGVSAAAISNSLPLRYTILLSLLIHVPGYEKEQAVPTRAVGGAYFAAMGMRFAAGRPFNDRVKGESVVNEAFVHTYLNDRPAVGGAIEGGGMTITGVVKDVRHLGLGRPAPPEVFIPFADFPLNPIDTAVRSTLPPGQIARAMQRELRSLDDRLALGRVLTMSEVVDHELARPRFQAVLLGLFAMVAMALAAVGTYGVIAYNVRSRVPEFGLRRALGARTVDLLRLVLADGMKPPLLGLVLGLSIAAFAAGRYLQTLLYGITARDPAVLMFTGSVLLVAALLACLIPGRSAARVEPSRALRQE